MALALQRGRGTAALIVFTLLGCDIEADVDGSRLREAIPIAEQEGAVCGMIVREQSAPRGQVIHSDGSRLFFCSLGDMLVHLAAPSPHGHTEAIFVEVMAAGDDPMQSHTGDHPWALAEDAFYVVGIDRPSTMGEPVLAYRDRLEAESAMRRHGGSQLLNLTELRDWWKAQQAAQ